MWSEVNFQFWIQVSPTIWKENIPKKPVKWKGIKQRSNYFRPHFTKGDTKWMEIKHRCSQTQMLQSHEGWMLSVVPGEGTVPLNFCQYWILGGTDGLYRCSAHWKTNTDVIMFLPFSPQKTKILWISFSYWKQVLM